MERKHKVLLVIDGIINLILGLLLLLFPLGIAQILGVPESDINFYPSILGAVIFGIGIALIIEVYGKPKGIHGLGLGGAIAINLCGAGVLLVWLLLKRFEFPLRGQIILWSIALIVLLVGIIELITKSYKYK
ncbi:MAG: hypothetical protein JW743_11115 [Deltaproteobacteria bacterium]|nr:hypothetical protein [Deltaproteobacteria bacterium]MBN2846264.1 hypothetical protein [Deltaproteobacteria bacterium]